MFCLDSDFFLLKKQWYKSVTIMTLRPKWLTFMPNLYTSIWSYFDVSYWLMDPKRNIMNYGNQEVPVTLSAQIWIRNFARILILASCADLDWRGFLIGFYIFMKKLRTLPRFCWFESVLEVKVRMSAEIVDPLQCCRCGFRSLFRKYKGAFICK